MKIEIPTDIVVDALAGKTSVVQAFRLSEDDQVTHALKEGWHVVSCGLIEGDLEAAEAPKLMLELVPPNLAVYWPKKKPPETK